MRKVNFDIPSGEIMSPGHLACPGCGGAHAMRLLLKTLGKRTMLVIPACCWSVIDGPFPFSAARVPVIHVPFASAAASASGLRAGLDMRGEHDINVCAWAGDGGTFDIGIQALSGAAERNENFIFFCYDNEAYMNTGIQRSSSTPFKAWTMTTPAATPKEHLKKDIIGIMASHNIPYVATASVSDPDDLTRKIRKASSIKGMKFIHILAPCPSGWKSLPEYSVKLARLAVDTKVFPLFEIEHGKLKITRQPREDQSLREYYSLQGRFGHLKEDDLKEMEEIVDKRWQKILRQEKEGF